MSPALRAHHRLLETTPKERIRTHERTNFDDRRGWPTMISKPLIERYRALKAAGAKYKEIRKELHVNTAMMRKLKERM